MSENILDIAKALTISLGKNLGELIESGEASAADRKVALDLIREMGMLDRRANAGDESIQERLKRLLDPNTEDLTLGTADPDDADSA